MPRPSRRSALCAVLAAAALTGCGSKGKLNSPEAIDPVTGKSEKPTTKSTNVTPSVANKVPFSNAIEVPASFSALSCAESEVPDTRIWRLTHEQFDNAVLDLLGLDLRLGKDFLPPLEVGGYVNNAEQLRVTPTLASQYQSAAEKVSEAAVAKVASLLPCQVPLAAGSACVKNFVVSFGRKAWRRTLDDAEIAKLTGVFDTVVTASKDPKLGVRALLEAILLSPHFLYRTELGVPLGNGTNQLTPWEIASALSFLYWESIPDEALLAAAGSGKLGTPEGLKAEAMRLLSDPKSERFRASFFDSWLGIRDLDTLQKDATAFPGFTPELRADLKGEVHAFVKHVVERKGGSFTELLGSSESVINDRLAAFYKVGGTFTAAWTPATLDPARRAGLLTMPAVLARHSGNADSGPVFRGVAVLDRVLCTKMPNPPADLMITEPPHSTTLTTRERFARHSSSPACASCHTIIDPIGFGFEDFDAVGRFRTTENGKPVDASGVLPALAGVPDSAFSGGANLARALSTSPKASSCFNTQYFRFATGRLEGTKDSCTIELTNQWFAKSGFNVNDLMLAPVMTRSFVFKKTPQGK